MRRRNVPRIKSRNRSFSSGVEKENKKFVSGPNSGRNFTESYLTDKRCGRSSSRPVEASTLPAADDKIVCDFDEKRYIARIAGPSKTAACPFPLEGKLLGCFCEVRFPVFSSWPSTWTVLSSVLSCLEIYRRFTGGFARNRGLLGHSVRTVRSMQNLQIPCPARFSAKSLIWRVGT
jgi:hypothetical protein